MGIYNMADKYTVTNTALDAVGDKDYSFKKTKVVQNGEAGASSGAVLGGITGLLIGMSALALPSVGGMLIGGIVAVAVSGALIGTLIGEIVGSLLTVA